MKSIYLLIVLIASILSVSCSTVSTEPTLGRTFSSLPDCLEETHKLIKENVKLRKSSRYWVASSIICADSEKYDLEKIFSFHKDLNDENYYHGGVLNTGISYYPPLIIAITLNGDKSKLTLSLIHI